MNYVFHRANNGTMTLTVNFDIKTDQALTRSVTDAHQQANSQLPSDDQRRGRCEIHGIAAHAGEPVSSQGEL
jgi:multidrug efflux pump subunit AcrB